MILLLKSYPYHFVRTILSIPFCPIPFCPYTILSISFCPYHFVRYHFVLEPTKLITLECLYTRCLRKNCAKLFLSELRQISINFINFWQVDGKMAEILGYIYIFYLTSLMFSHYLAKHKSTKFYCFSGKL